MPAFSVLMSIYPSADPEYFDQALHSVVAQTVPPTEIVIVEDGPVGSGLRTVEQRYQERFSGAFKVVSLAENQGLGHAMAVGVRAVTTDWIARMDADDISLPTRFEQQLRAIKAHPELALVGGQITEFTSDPGEVTGVRKVPTNAAAIVHFLKWRSPFNHPTVMINRKKLLAVGGYQPFGTYEDYYLWSRMIVAGYSVENLPTTLVRMRAGDAMYARRGQYHNVRYILRLKRYLYRHGVINRRELVAGSALELANVAIPCQARKLVYHRYLHR